MSGPSITAQNINRPLGGIPGTRLERAVEPLLAAHATAGESGIVALRDGRDAFAARYLLAEAAERTLDLQYYIWHDDMAGGLLFDAIRRAAERGVRVRLLLDDNTTVGLDAMLASLDAHPAIEVRLFNPFQHRRWRFVDYLSDFGRLNRRMHNKSFTADGQVTIVGGRNVGDEYFDASHELMFVDLDVLAIGPVVNDVSRDFERYWNSESARPATEVLPPIEPATAGAMTAKTQRLHNDPATRAYRNALDDLPFVRELLAGTLPIVWARTTMVSDDPVKGLGPAADDRLLFTRLKALVGMPKNDLCLISAYFVPGTAGVDYLSGLASHDVHVAILTNSLEATDVPIVHAGYAKRRYPLLRAGVELFEMKRGAAAPSAAKFRTTGGSMSSSGSSLHAKTFAVDGARVFVGSFNFDPRSARLNTELGFIIDSPALAGEITKAFADRIPQRAYAVTIARNRLNWSGCESDRPIVYTSEPGTSRLKRLMIRLLGSLPIEWLL